MFWVYLAVSFLLVGFGQPAWVPEAGLLAAAGGYALFWKAMLQLPKRLPRCLLAAGWFLAVHGVQLSWMTATEYMGPLILAVYLFLLLGLGAQFALLSAFLDPKKPLTQSRCLALAGMFVLLEWMRLFFLTGFTWNPAGLALAGSRYSIQWAAVFGIYGLTFWVIWTNLSALSLLRSPSFKKCAVWLFLALFPHGFGLAHEIWVKTLFQAKKEIWAAAVDTSLKVEEKNRDRLHPEAYVPPLIQWERVWSYLDPKRPLDLIILPEAAFPYGTDEPHCPVDLLKERWRLCFGAEEADFPPLEAPYAELCNWKGQPQWMATNAFFAQTLANRFKAHVIVGFDYDETDNRRRNSAFLFRPKSSFERYDKRILAPVGEYIPLQNVEWIAEFLLREFGIGGSFEPGTEAKVFQSHVPIGVPICLEEMYSGLARDLRRRGAELFVSLSNDVWFPGTRLAKQHLDHGRIRAVENGVFLLRSSNMGWTGAIDCFGQPIKMRSPGAAGAIYFSVPAFSYPTLFSLWGDNAILVVSIGAIAVFALRERRRKSCP